jgi:hypothetical protein
MSTSGTNTFNLVTKQIIDLAYSRLGIYSQFHDLTSFQYSQGLTLLNMMTKNFKVYGDFLWKTCKGVLFLVSGQNEYILDGSTANATQTNTLITTTLSADADSGATSVTLTSVTGISIGYYIGIELDDNSIFFTTVSNISGYVVTIADAITDSATSGNSVYSYETNITRPENITSLQTQLSTTTQIDCVKLSRNSYDRLPIKTSIQSFPSQFYYDKQLTLGNIFLWPTPNNTAQYCYFTYQAQFFDFTDSTNNPDFPQEWLNVLILNLAVILAGYNGIKDPDFITILKQEAQSALVEAKGYDNEETSIYFQPASVINTGNYR